MIVSIETFNQNPSHQSRNKPQAIKMVSNPYNRDMIHPAHMMYLQYPVTNGFDPQSNANIRQIVPTDGILVC